MTFYRTGECNQCGECCGYPRPDGEQNNAWEVDLIEGTRNWDMDVLESELPILKLIDVLVNRGQISGRVDIAGKRCYWIFVPGHGLCTDKTPHGDVSTFDQRCPFLDKKKSDGTVPCILYNTKEKYIWDKLCESSPPLMLERQEYVEQWFKNCPGCSYRYE